MIRRERGTALLLVLWATMLLGTLLLGVAAASRSQGEAALYGSERVRAELAAEAGLAHAVVGLRSPDPRGRWVPDGRPYAFDFDGARVTVAVVDVGGLVDLNAGGPRLLAGLFEAAGANGARAAQLADAVVAWRGSTPFATAATNPAHGPFRTVDQLAQLPGMGTDLYARVEPAVTVYSGRGFPDPEYAGPLALAAAQGIDVRQAESLVDARRRRPAQRGAGSRQVTGGPLVAGQGGSVERVFSTAVMPDGTQVGLNVTIRMTLTTAGARPYKVLDWRTNSGGSP